MPIRVVSISGRSKGSTTTGEGLTEGDGEGLAEGDGEGLTEGDGEGLTESDGEGLTEGDGEGLTEGDGEGLTEGDGEGLTDGKGDVDGGITLPGSGDTVFTGEGVGSADTRGDGVRASVSWRGVMIKGVLSISSPGVDGVSASLLLSGDTKGVGLGDEDNSSGLSGA